MAAAVAIGTVGAVCASANSGAAAACTAGGGNKTNNKKKGLADRTNSNSGNSDSNAAQDDEEDDMEMADMDVGDVNDAGEVLAKQDVDDEEEDDDDGDDDDDDDDDALTLTNFDHTNASLLTVEQSPAKQEAVENNYNNNTAAAIEPIGVIHEEQQDVVGIEGPTPRATDGQVFAGFSPVTTTTTSTTSSSTGTVTANVNASEQQEMEQEEQIEDEALMSTYSFSLYEAEVSLLDTIVHVSVELVE